VALPRCTLPARVWRIPQRRDQDGSDSSSRRSAQRIAHASPGASCPSSLQVQSDRELTSHGCWVRIEASDAAYSLSRRGDGGIHHAPELDARGDGVRFEPELVRARGRTQRTVDQRGGLTRRARSHFSASYPRTSIGHPPIGPASLPTRHPVPPRTQSGRTIQELGRIISRSCGRAALVGTSASGSRYVVVSDGARFALLPAGASLRAALGKVVTLTRDEKGRLALRPVGGKDVGS
jgi:hypothetical protein